MSIIQMSITAGMLILGIALFRTLFLHRLPKKVMVILWEIAILRLLFPFTVPVSVPDVSLWNAEHVQTEEPEDQTAEENEGKTALTEEKNTVEIAGYGKFGLTADMGIRVLYGAGVFIMAAASIFVYVRDKRIFMEGLPMSEEERGRLTCAAGFTDKEREQLNKIRFQVSDRTATPVTYGIFQSAIVFPKEMSGEAGASFCVHHELVHIKNHDNLKKLIVHAVLCIHWFNPMVWMMYLLFNRDMELLCDETVIRDRKESRKDYALALLSLAEQKNSGFLTGLGFGKNSVKERIEAIMKMKKITFGGIVAAVIAVTVSLTSFVTAAEKTNAPSEDEFVETLFAEVEDEYTELEKKALGEEKNQVDGYIKKKEEEIAALKKEIEMQAEWLEREALLSELTEKLEEADKEFRELSRYREELQNELDALNNEYANFINLGVNSAEGRSESVEKLVEKYREYGLSAEYTDDDYQLYFEEEPVYFFADNRNFDGGHSFSGTLFAKVPGEENGYTGVITRYDEERRLIGLERLSEEESKAFSDRFIW